MATVILVRHGRTTANATGVLAGRTAGVRLDDTGTEQARRAGERIAAVPLAAIVSSPLERCRQTAKAVLGAQQAAGAPGAEALRVVLEKGITECDYGDWQGRSLKDLVKEPLWSTVQAQPSAVTFPGGESMGYMQARAVAAVRRHDAAVEAAHGSGAVWVAVSHGDIIKSVLADALGMHLDLFQRIGVDPASVSIVRYTGARPYVLASNTHDGDLSWLTAPPPAKPKRRGGRSRSAKAAGTGEGDAVVGGGAGPGLPPSSGSEPGGSATSSTRS
jgi:probable phosphomutase (TIGR03848 family)